MLSSSLQLSEIAVSTEPVPELDLTTLKSRHRQMRMRTCNLRGLSLNGYVIRSHPLHAAQRIVGLLASREALCWV